MSSKKNHNIWAWGTRPIFTLLTLLFFFPGCLDPDKNEPPNKPPVLESVVADPHSVYLNETSTITATASDPDRDRLVYEWQADLGILAGNGHEIYYAAPPCCANWDIVRVTVRDGKGGVVRGSVELIINQ